MNKSRHIVLFGAALLFTSIVACASHSRLPRSQYNTAGLNSSGNWLVETSTTRYGVQRFSATDSSLVLEGGTWMEDIRGQGPGYPAGKTKKLSRTDMPIVIPMKDVRPVEKVAFSPGKTTAVAVVGGGVIAFVVYM